MAALAGVLLALDLGQFDSASPYLDVAWKAARAVDSAELQAVVLGCRSFTVAYGTGDHTAGRELADLACDIASHGATVTTRGWVTAIGSERCASTGDIDGCRRRLDKAQLQLDRRHEATNITWQGIGGFDQDKLLAYKGGDMVRLGRYSEAESILDTAIARLDPGQHRHRCTALIDRADARLAANELEGACADAAAALRLVSTVRHTGNFHRITSIARHANDAGTQTGRQLWRDVRAAHAEYFTPVEAPR
jgi:hypothetical protein